MGHRTLEITLQYAKDLNKVNLITKMDVYAVVLISGGDSSSKQKTKTPVDHDGDANPHWNFPMTFTVDEAALQMNRLTLDFKLVCQRALGDKDVGEVCVPIKELFDSPAKAGGEGHQFVSYQVRKAGGKPKGQLSFSYKFSENFAAAAAPPYGAATPLAPPSGKADAEPVTAYPTGSSSTYPPTGVYPPPAAYEGSGHYPPPYTTADGGGTYPPPTVYPPPPPSGGYHVYPPPPPSGGYGYPPPPPPGYGYPPPPPPGYGHPTQPGYGYPPPYAAAQQPKKNKFGMGLGAGLLGGAIGGLLVGDMISDGGDFDSGGFDF